MGDPISFDGGHSTCDASHTHARALGTCGELSEITKTTHPWFSIFAALFFVCVCVCLCLFQLPGDVSAVNTSGPCTFGSTSITADDPAFGEQMYVRGRAWAPQAMLVYLGLAEYVQRAVRLEKTRVRVIFLDFVCLPSRTTHRHGGASYGVHRT